MRKGSPSGLDLLEGPLGSAILPEDMLVLVVHAALTTVKPETHVDVCSLGAVLRLCCLRTHAGVSACHV